VKEKDIYISSGPRPFWQLIIASVFYTLVLFSMYKFIRGMIDSTPSVLWVLGSIFAFVLGLQFSLTNSFHFDIEKRQFKEDFHIGPFFYGEWEPFPDLDYVSVFNFKEGFYQINLWIKGNDFYTITGTNDLKIALEVGESIAKKLNIDLLDAATDPRNSVWIKLEN